MFEIEKFVTVKSDKEMEAELLQAQDQLNKVKEAFESFEAYKKNLLTDEEKLFKISPRTQAIMKYYKSPADLIIFTLFWASHPDCPNIVGDILAWVGKIDPPLNRQEQLREWREIIVNLIGEHPEKEAAVRQLDWYVESLLDSK